MCCAEINDWSRYYIYVLGISIFDFGMYTRALHPIFTLDIMWDE